MTTSNERPGGAELLPCPFCGGRAAFNSCSEPESENAGGEWIYCTRCQASTNIRFPLMEPVKDLLAEQWNRRTAHLAPQAEPPPLTAEMANAIMDGNWVRRAEVWNALRAIAEGRATPQPAEQPQATEPDIAKLRAEEPKAMRRLRWLLAMQFTGGPPRLYTDDGEYSDGDSGIDFRRDSVEQIETAMIAYRQRLNATSSKMTTAHAPNATEAQTETALAAVGAAEQGPIIRACRQCSEQLGGQHQPWCTNRAASSALRPAVLPHECAVYRPQAEEKPR